MKQNNDQTESGRSQNLYKMTYVAKQVTETKTCYVVAASLEEATSILEKRMFVAYIILGASLEASGDNGNIVSPKLFIAI